MATEQQRIANALQTMAGIEPSKANETKQQRIAAAVEVLAQGGGGGGSSSIVILDVKSFPDNNVIESYYYIPYNYEENRVMTKAEIDSILMRCIENNAVLRMIERITVEGEARDRIACITPTNYFISNDYSAIFYMNTGYSGSEYSNTAINYITIEYDNVNGMLVAQYSTNAVYSNPRIVYDIPEGE